MLFGNRVEWGARYYSLCALIEISDEGRETFFGDGIALEQVGKGIVPE
jgi:hypothetical protein